MKATTRIQKTTTVTVELSEEQVQEAVRRYVASSIPALSEHAAALQTALTTNASGVGVDFDTSGNFLRGAVVSVKLVETEEA